MIYTEDLLYKYTGLDGAANNGGSGLNGNV